MNPCSVYDVTLSCRKAETSCPVEIRESLSEFCKAYVFSNRKCFSR